MAFGALTLLTRATALGGDVPFAAPPPSGEARADPSDKQTSLADTMNIMQLRHMRLWDAGTAGNWDLVDYETDRIAVSLKDAALIYIRMPLEDVMAMRQPMDDLHVAIRSKDKAKFIQAYFRLTSACNRCHIAGHVGFIHIHVPTASSFSDEFFGIGTGDRESVSRR